jgi:hypothetical protein
MGPLSLTPGKAKPDRQRPAGGATLYPYIIIPDMLFSGIIFAWFPVALAQYVVPAADGSDGWQDAFEKAKSMFRQSRS